MIYLDNAATTPLLPSVKESMVSAMDVFGNPSATYKLGKIAREVIEKSRAQIAECIGVSPEEIIFTSGGTEADNIATFCGSSTLDPFASLIVSAIEHKAMYDALGAEHVIVNKQGVVDTGYLKWSLDQYDCDGGLVSVMAVNNETGVAQPYNECAEIAHKYGCQFHTDAVQAFGHRPIDLSNVDYMSVSGHKIHGPKGVGFLYKKKLAHFSPTFSGGGQEFGYRNGTENTIGIIGLAEAVRCAIENIKPMNLFWLENRLVNECGAKINGTSCFDDPYKHIINFQLPDIQNDTLIQFLSEKEIYVSAGSACHAHSITPSHVLKAMGLTDDECNRSIRISPSEDFDNDQASIVINEINKIRKELKEVQSFRI